MFEFASDFFIFFLGWNSSPLEALVTLHSPHISCSRCLFSTAPDNRIAITSQIKFGDSNYQTDWKHPKKNKKLRHDRVRIPWPSWESPSRSSSHSCFLSRRYPPSPSPLTTGGRQPVKRKAGVNLKSQLPRYSVLQAIQAKIGVYYVRQK